MTTSNNEQEMDNSSIPLFYSGRSIFITGATGFLGKVLVEKLLRSCPDVKAIYLLIRPKREREMAARLNELLNSPLFDTIRSVNPKALNKVIPIAGDMTFEGLGISETDQLLLIETVSIVFHSAAAIRMHEKLKLAVTINMVGTKSLVELCRRMISLEALVHVSTAYCNSDRLDVSEYVYKTPFRPEDIISLVNWLPEDLLDELTPSLLGKRPNTYTLTKAMSEQMLLQESTKFPVAIVRPSLVGACLKEPTPGWTDTYFGISGFVAAIGKGVLRTLICKPKCLLDVVPVDIVINLLIVVAWKTATTKSSELTVYNCVTSKQSPLPLDKFFGYAKKFMRLNPLEGIWWYPTLTLFTNRQLYLFVTYVVHFIPAYIIDLFAWASGNRQIMVKTQQKTFKMVEAVKYFGAHQWDFSDDNVRKLLVQMDENDRKSFQIDVSEIDWDKYMENYALGVRKFLFKQNPNTVPSCKRTISK